MYSMSVADTTVISGVSTMHLSEAVRVLVLGDGRRFPVLPRETLHMLFPND